MASVCVPVGMSSKVAVSSVTTDRKTRQNAATRPGPAIRAVTRHNTASRRCPSDLATSSRPTGALASDALTPTRASGKNMIA